MISITKYVDTKWSEFQYNTMFDQRSQRKVYLDHSAGIVKLIKFLTINFGVNDNYIAI